MYWRYQSIFELIIIIMPSPCPAAQIFHLSSAHMRSTDFKQNNANGNCWWDWTWFGWRNSALAHHPCNNVFILKLSNKYSSGYHRNCVHRAITPLTRNTSVRWRPSVLVSCFASIFLIPEVQCLSSEQQRSSVLGSANGGISGGSGVNINTICSEETKASCQTLGPWEPQLAGHVLLFSQSDLLCSHC